MNVRSVLLLLLAVVAVGIVVVLSNNYFKGVEKQAGTKVAAKPLNRILVAKRTLNIGTTIVAKDFLWVNWPDKALRPEYITEKQYKSADLKDKIIRHTVVQGAPLTRASLVSAKDRSKTAAVITPGMRAVSVTVNAQTGISGFAFAGDRVDVILSHVVQGEGKVRFPVSETVMQNVRVLGVDTRGFGDEGKVKAAKTATLEVTPKMAEKLALVSRLGTLSLSLRSFADKNGKPSITPIGETLSRTWGADVSKVLPRMDAKKKAGNSIRVTRGSQTTEQKLEGK